MSHRRLENLTQYHNCKFYYEDNKQHWGSLNFNKNKLTIIYNFGDKKTIIYNLFLFYLFKTNLLRWQNFQLYFIFQGDFRFFFFVWQKYPLSLESKQ